MNLKRRNQLLLGFLGYTTGLLLFWLFSLFWLTKMIIFWTPVEFLLVFIPVMLIFSIIFKYFITAFIKIKKNLNERIRFSKKSIYASVIVWFLFSSLTIMGILMFLLPSAMFFYKYDDGPYLIWNDDPETTITIIWITKDPEESELKYGRFVDDMETITKNFYEIRHIIELKDLKPGTTYYYKIPGFSSELYNFTTAPSGTKSFNFVALGDTQNPGSNLASNYSRVITAMEPYDYDFIVNVGDNIHDGNDLNSWHVFLNQMAKHASNRPYMIALGNHEYGKDFFGKNFKYFFPYDYAEPFGHYYSFDYSNAHFCVIDVFQNPIDWGGYIPEVQVNWLKKDLAANKDKWLFVMLHAAPFSTGDFNMNPRLQEQLGPIFYEYEVDVVLSGHDHMYEAFLVNRTEDWGGTYYFVTGGGGGSLDKLFINRAVDREYKWHNSSIEAYQDDYNTLENQLYGEITYHFLHLEVDGNYLDIQGIRDDGTLIQEFRIKK